MEHAERTPLAPRDYFETPSEFGTNLRARPVPRPATLLAQSEWETARLHHAIAATFSERLALRGKTRRQAAERMAISYRYLGRVLRGEVWLSAKMLGLMEVAVGGLVVAVLMPPGRPVRRAVRPAYV